MKEEKILEFIKMINERDCHDSFSDVGFLMMTKDTHLKKKKTTMKKFNVIFYGDTIEELKKNMFIIINEIECFYDMEKRE